MIEKLAPILFAVSSLLFSGVAWADEDSFADIPFFMSTLNSVLGTSVSGTQTTWKNPATRNHGVITPFPAFTTSTGDICRKYERTWVIEANLSTYEGTACRETTGRWKIRDETGISSAASVVKPADSGEAGEIALPAATDSVVDKSRKKMLVVDAQRLLTQLGYDPGVVDGVAGAKTRAATQKFQKREGLPEDSRI